MKARALNAAVPSFDDLGHLERALERAFATVLAEAGRRAAARFEEFVGHALVAAPGVGSSTAMVAVYPSAEQQALVARQGGEDPDVIHCTLAFLGEVDPDQAEAAVAAVARVAGERSPLEGEVGGVAVFGDNGEGHPSIVLPDVGGLAELRHAVCEALDEAGIFRATNHGWTPHLTLSYEEEPRTPPAALIGLPLSFDSLSVSVGDVRRDLALGGGLGRHSAADAEPAAEREAVSAAGPPSWTQPHPDELVNVDDLIRKFRTKADPVRLAAIKAAAGPALKAAGIDFDATNPLIDAVYARVGQHIAYVAETTRLNAMRIVRRSYEEGLSIPDTAKAIREGMAAASAVRATLIARTEMTSLTNGGSLAAARIIDDELSRARDDGEPDAQDFGGYRKRWLTAPGAHFPRHEDYEGLDGQTVGLDEFFDVGGEQLLYPGDPAGPPEEVCNCFPAETLVEMPALRAGIRRWYDGDLVRVRVASGDELSGTPNHPVLRSDGRWVPLRDLREGDEVISASLVRYDVAAPDVDRPPSEIGEVYRLAESASVAERVVVRPGDLHGDAVSDSEVDVVAVDGSLLLDSEAASDEEVAQFGLAVADLASPSLGARQDSNRASDRSLRHDVPTTALVRWSRYSSALLGAKTAEAETVRFGTGTSRQIKLREATGDDVPADAESGRDSEDAVTLRVSLTKVVEIDVRPFQGAVFNLDTGCGWYIANSLLAANCRCTLVYVDAGGEETDGGEADSMGASGAAVPFTGDLEGGADVKPKKTTPEEALAADLADEAAAAELAPPQDDVPAPMEGDCANCGHGAADHAGEMNDGACEVGGCDCEAMVEADASPDSEENSGGMTAFVRIRPELDPEFHADVAKATKSAMRSGMIAAFFGDEAGPHGTSGPSGATFDVVESVPADVRPERSDEIVQPEVELRTSAQQRWEAEFCPEGYATDDGRIFAPGSIGWRDLPLSLMAMTETPGEGGHAGAKLAGRIERIWRDESSVPTMIRAEGTFDDGEYGDEIARLVGDQTLRGNSVDLAIRRAEFGPRAIYVDDAGLWRDDAPADGEAPEPSLEELLDGDVAMVVREARIGMSTVCPFPAFDNAGIVLVAATDSSPAFAVEEQGGIHWRIWLKDSVRPQGDVVTASADGLVPVQPPAEWFDDPELDELTPLTVTEDGRVFGHAWSWNECHIGFPGTCVVAPRSNTGYAYFHLKQVECDDGAFVDVGTITLGTGHADQRATPQAAAEHYDNTGTAVADVRIYEDEFGGAVAGALRPDVAAGRVRELRGSTPSGDWRKRNGNLELVGLLAVNVPGFPVPRTRALVASSEGGEAEVLALVAAGIPERPAGVGYVEFVDAADRARLAALAARAEGGLEALARLAASGEVLVAAPVWDSENGLMDVMGDVAAALNPGESWRWYVLDVSIGGESAIVCDGDENTFWLVPLGYDDAGEPVVPPQSEWTEVESEWVAAEAASAFDRFARERLAALADRAAA